MSLRHLVLVTLCLLATTATTARAYDDLESEADYELVELYEEPALSGSFGSAFTPSYPLQQQGEMSSAEPLGSMGMQFYEVNEQGGMLSSSKKMPQLQATYTHRQLTAQKPQRLAATIRQERVQAQPVYAKSRPLQVRPKIHEQRKPITAPQHVHTVKQTQTVIQPEVVERTITQNVYIPQPIQQPHVVHQQIVKPHVTQPITQPIIEHQPIVRTTRQLQPIIQPTVTDTTKTEYEKVEQQGAAQAITNKAQQVVLPTQYEQEQTVTLPAIAETPRRMQTLQLTK